MLGAFECRQTAHKYSRGLLKVKKMRCLRQIDLLLYGLLPHDCLTLQALPTFELMRPVCLNQLPRSDTGAMHGLHTEKLVVYERALDGFEDILRLRRCSSCKDLDDRILPMIL